MTGPQPAAVYTHGHQEAVLRSHRSRTAADSAGYLLPGLRPGQSLLDVGCGPGTITADLAGLVGPQGRVVAVDTSAEVLEQAAGYVAGRGLSNVVFERADVHRLPYRDGEFDVVHAHQVLQHVADPVAALRELRRVTAPGGVVAARDVDYASMTWFPEVPALDRWLELYRRTARANGGEPDAGRRLLSWARAAGFTEVTASATTWTYATPGQRAWWGGMWADRVTGTALGRTAVERGFAEPDELDRIAAGWREWSDAGDGWFSMLHGEVLARG
ncbi:methyltransferase domain-containing protein [Streptomyces sp. CBMA156]|uniref:methyltransferase domain-containing protein n=1 Tax=Streptomyces sp. CBMA156 TaxID=1930280 RepID=UPI00166199A1|nr:methyltransferase domain-containing protein [Streptomyces sp. CBMA156]MBD0669395.1 SAM-dependent methyltransferase [Streptomyces sp. CBMA156]MBD0675289.1 SAM-dependent methyltransferase [Streptomyces sp. CBMA156]